MSKSRRERRESTRVSAKNAAKGLKELKELGAYYQRIKDLPTEQLLEINSTAYKRHQNIISLIIKERNEQPKD